MCIRDSQKLAFSKADSVASGDFMSNMHMQLTCSFSQISIERYKTKIAATTLNSFTSFKVQLKECSSSYHMHGVNWFRIEKLIRSRDIRSLYVCLGHFSGIPNYRNEN